MKKVLISFFLFSSIVFASQPTLLFYCGITMVKPMAEMAKIVEEKHNCHIKIIQGGSKDLYNSLAKSQKGDIYLPGSDSFRTNNLKDGYLLDEKYIGYNQAAIFVQKGNPLKITTLDSVLNEEIATILGDYNSGSIGRMTKKVLQKYKGKEFFQNAYDLAAIIGSDSRNLNKSMIDKVVDMTINWKASATWPENKDHIDVIEIDEKYAPKKRLVMNLLSFSKHPLIVKDFMNIAASKEGQVIMKKYGFVD